MICKMLRNARIYCCKIILLSVIITIVTIFGVNSKARGILVSFYKKMFAITDVFNTIRHRGAGFRTTPVYFFVNFSLNNSISLVIFYFTNWAIARLNRHYRYSRLKLFFEDRGTLFNIMIGVFLTFERLFFRLKLFEGLMNYFWC